MLCADWSVMKAGICIMCIPLAMAKVPTLYHFYGTILLGCHRSAKGELNSATPELRDYIGSLSRSLASDFHLTVPQSLPFTPCLLSHLVYYFSHFDSAGVIHSSISVVLSQGFNRGSRQCGRNTQTYSLSLAFSGSQEGPNVDLTSGDL